MSYYKHSQQNFNQQSREIRSQLLEQIKCMEQRTVDRVAIFQEVNEFIRRRAELDFHYSKELEKLVKSAMLKHKNERIRRSNWSFHSICNLWQQMVDDAKDEAKHRFIIADVCTNYIVPSISSKCGSLQKISKKCRDIALLAAGEVIRVLNELSLAMKTYQNCHKEFSILNRKLQQMIDRKRKLVEANSSLRKQNYLQKACEKKNEKLTVARQKCLRARNEYLLCIDAANSSLYKYFADDISNTIDCDDMGMDFWLRQVLQNFINARKSACQTEMNALANLSGFHDSLDSKVDKQRFFENNNQTFMLPKIFDFKPDHSETIFEISTYNLGEEFKQRHNQIRKRLKILRFESDTSWTNMIDMEKKIQELTADSNSVEINEYGIIDNRSSVDVVDQEINKIYESYLQTFTFFLLNANLISRLEARANRINQGLKDEQHKLKSRNTSLGSLKLDSEEFEIETVVYQQQKRCMKEATENEHHLFSSWASRPRLFSGSLVEYTEGTGEQIPLIVVSCIRTLSLFALQHQGIFRISGSQIEINRLREAFENGHDPLNDVKCAADANSIAGLLKLYLRELREPLFPFYLFDLLTDCAKYHSISDFISKIRPLINKLPPPSYVLLRYLFAFLNHMSEFSDENMMDPYNLAICFGPTLFPIPEGKDQVIFQNSVNEVIRNLIVHHNAIFDDKIYTGPKYDKYNISGGQDTPADTEMELFVDDDELGLIQSGGNSMQGLEGGGEVYIPFNLNSSQAQQLYFEESNESRKLKDVNKGFFHSGHCLNIHSGSINRDPQMKDQSLKKQKVTAKATFGPGEGHSEEHCTMPIINSLNTHDCCQFKSIDDLLNKLSSSIQEKDDTRESFST